MVGRLWFKNLSAFGTEGAGRDVVVNSKGDEDGGEGADKEDDPFFL